MATWSSAIALKGADGLSVLTGSGAPASSLGVANQAYLDVQNAVLYQKTSSGWPSTGISLVGPQSQTPGPQGQIGPSGSVIYSATGQPPSGTGIAGDYFYSSDTYVFFGPKPSATSWTNATQSLLKGVQGQIGSAGSDGKSIRSGSTAPSSSTTANVGDFYLQTGASPVLYGPATAANTFPSSGVPLVGPQGQAGVGTQGNSGADGKSVRSGSSAPSSSTTANVGDFYIQTTTPYTIFGPATAANTFPATGVSLVGPQGQAGVATAGSQIISGTGSPPANTGVVSDYFFATDTGTLTGPKQSATSWSGATSTILKGAQGQAGVATAGSQIISGTGTPPANTGAVSDYYFATDTYTLTGPKQSATSWSGATSTVLRGAAGTSGAAGSQIISSTGTPPAGTGAINDYFFAIDTGTLTGPKPSATSWSGATSTILKGAVGQTGASGNTIRNGTSAPGATTPSQAGDFYLQTGSSPVLYGPSTGGAGTYPTTGTSLIGPTGATGASGSSSGTASTVGSGGLTFADNTVQNTAFPGAIALSTNTATTGPSVWYNGGSLTATAVLMQTTGATTTQYFVPPTASGFYGCMAVNFNTSASTINVQLYNLTDSVAIWTTPSSLATGSVNSFGPFAITTYPMVANKQYVWRISGSGTTYANVIPQYFVPSSAAYATQYPAPSMISTAATLSSTAYNCRIPGNNTLTQYYRFNTGGFFTYATLQNFSTATAAVFLLQNAAGTTIYTSPSVAAGATTSVGPFGPGAYYLAAATSYMWSVTGSGSATVLINWAYVG